jgi:hypothetical protein
MTSKRVSGKRSYRKLGGGAAGAVALENHRRNSASGLATSPTVAAALKE